MMTISKDPYKAHCQKCQYDWIKNTEKDPVCCPNCHSRKWKEPKKQDEYGKLWDEINNIEGERFELSDSINEDFLSCPVCKNHPADMCTHNGSPKYAVSEGDPYDTVLVIPFWSECGHQWNLVITHVNGQSEPSIRNFRDYEVP